MRIAVDDLTHPAVHALLAEHLADMRATSPEESCHVLDLTALRDPSIVFYACWEGEDLLATGALKALSAQDAEVKSMRTTRSARGRGVGSGMLRHLLAEARAGGFGRVLLETGSQDYFEPARRLYLRHGFVVRGPFADYVEDPNSVFMELWLSPSARTHAPAAR